MLALVLGGGITKITHTLVNDLGVDRIPFLVYSCSLYLVLQEHSRPQDANSRAKGCWGMGKEGLSQPVPAGPSLTSSQAYFLSPGSVLELLVSCCSGT